MMSSCYPSALVHNTVDESMARGEGAEEEVICAVLQLHRDPCSYNEAPSEALRCSPVSLGTGPV